jgi:S-adenosylmethionine:tRNA ribosyltransferase-isomerase
MRVDLFDFDLPEERIALRPASRATAPECWSSGRARKLEDRTVRELPSLLGLATAGLQRHRHSGN